MHKNTSGNSSSGDMLERFLNLHPRKIDLSLGRTIDLLAKIGHPQKRLPPVIHVAGTNGKGSTVAFMRAMLEAAGKNVHVYTSPHLVNFHERIRLGAPGGGKRVSEAMLVDAFTRCENANAGASITIFEITTIAALLLFSEHPADYLLLEVGLGGRYDATNVIDHPLASVITPVSMDHMDFLGPTLGEIASAKAGIIKSQTPSFIGRQKDEALRVIEREAHRARAPLFLYERDFSAAEESGRLIYEDAKQLLDLPLPRLQGRHQIDNAALAIATLRHIAPDLTSANFEQGLLAADWPARLQNLARGRLILLVPPGAELWLDGGHNADGGSALAAAMGELEAKDPRPLVLICGSLASKETDAFLRAFSGLAKELLAVPIMGEHAARSAAEIAAIAEAEGIKAHIAADVPSALGQIAAVSWIVPPRILICGSLYLAGEVLAANGTPPE